MATNDEGERGRRRRRAWRQPRHEAGPISTAVTATTTESVSCTVNSTSTIVGSAARTAAIDPSSSVVGESSSACSPRVENEAEEKRIYDGAAKIIQEPSNAGGGDKGSMLEIDGSAMEGVGYCMLSQIFSSKEIFSSIFIIAGRADTKEYSNSGLPCATAGESDKGQRRSQ